MSSYLFFVVFFFLSLFLIILYILLHFSVKFSPVTPTPLTPNWVWSVLCILSAPHPCFTWQFFYYYYYSSPLPDSKCILAYTQMCTCMCYFQNVNILMGIIMQHNMNLWIFVRSLYIWPEFCMCVCVFNAWFVCKTVNGKQHLQ